VMIVNHSEEPRQLHTNIADGCSVYLIDQEHFITKTDSSAAVFTMQPNQIVLIKN